MSDNMKDGKNNTNESVSSRRDRSHMVSKLLLFSSFVSGINGYTSYQSSDDDNNKGIVSEEENNDDEV